ncbi:transcriptional regulator [Halonotius sp. F2-221B]|uniref:HVO_A0114 family putative DNA-binding protein n=1 Tax=Halonotius sp. F2-221B TaxID=2731620 RepID=UPI00398B1933
MSTPSNNHDETTAEIDTETEAGFLEDVSAADHPSTLRITARSSEAHKQDAIERAERWEAGEEVPRVINFQNPSDLRALLTDRRVELLQSVMSETAGSIRQLADRVDRDVKSVHDDLQVLADYDIVSFEQDGRAKRPFVPYEQIEVSLEISTPEPGDDTAAV